EDLDCVAGSCRPLDVDRRRLAEVDLEAEVRRERRLDDLFLHLAVERDRDLLASVVLPDVDQRILLGELRQGDAKSCAIVAIAGDDDRLERRRREVMSRRAGFELSDPVAYLDLCEPPQLGDGSYRHRRTLDGGAALEDRDGRHLALAVAAEAHTVAR